MEATHNDSSPKKNNIPDNNRIIDQLNHLNKWMNKIWMKMSEGREGMVV